MVYITMEDIEVHFVEPLQVVHHWFLDFHHFVAVHRASSLLNAGKLILLVYVVLWSHKLKLRKGGLAIC